MLFSLDGLSFKSLWACVPPYISLHVHTVPNVLPWSQDLAPAGGRTQSPDCVLHILVPHDWQETYFSCFLVYQLFEFGVQIAFYYGSAVACYKVDLLKWPRRSTYSEHTNDAFKCTAQRRARKTMNPNPSLIDPQSRVLNCLFQSNKNNHHYAFKCAAHLRLLLTTLRNPRLCQLIVQILQYVQSVETC